MNCTAYFLYTRMRPDRSVIRDEWIERGHPLAAYGAGFVSRNGNRALRVILMEDGKTVHNAFFDRDFEE